MNKAKRHNRRKETEGHRKKERKNNYQRTKASYDGFGPQALLSFGRFRFLRSAMQKIFSLALLNFPRVFGSAQ
jgi:hypothetical protein